VRREKNDPLLSLLNLFNPEFGIVWICLIFPKKILPKKFLTKNSLSRIMPSEKLLHVSSSLTKIFFGGPETIRVKIYRVFPEKNF